MVRRIIKRVKLNEAINSPSEGIFWYINGELIVLSDKINLNDYHSTDLLHINAWNVLKQHYKVNYPQ